MFSTEYYSILHMPQLSWCVQNFFMIAKYIMNQSIVKCHWISNFIEISLVQQVLGSITIKKKHIDDLVLDH